MMPTVRLILRQTSRTTSARLKWSFGGAVREVQPHDVDAGVEHALEDRGLA
jgi:hypothetical protein